MVLVFEGEEASVPVYFDIFTNGISQMVYKLYELTYEEVKIVDTQIDEVLSSLGLTKNDYENKTIEELSEQ